MFMFVCVYLCMCVFVYLCENLGSDAPVQHG